MNTWCGVAGETHPRLPADRHGAEGAVSHGGYASASAVGPCAEGAVSHGGDASASAGGPCVLRRCGVARRGRVRLRRWTVCRRCGVARRDASAPTGGSRLRTGWRRGQPRVTRSALRRVLAPRNRAGSSCRCGGWVGNKDTDEVYVGRLNQTAGRAGTCALHCDSRETKPGLMIRCTSIGCLQMGSLSVKARKA